LMASKKFWERELNIYAKFSLEASDKLV
jgi:hypothetical protein